MQDMAQHLEKLRRGAAECDLISKPASDLESATCFVALQNI
jgi:hypothetical protein